MSSKTAMKLNLSQCLRIEANQFRSADNRADYQAEEVLARKAYLEANETEKRIKALLWHLSLVPDTTEVTVIDEGHDACPPFDEAWIMPDGSYLVIPDVILPF